MYYNRIEDEILKGGHIGISEYMLLLENMDPENMNDWERRLMGEIAELRVIRDDVKALQIHLREKSREPVVPEFVMDPLLRQQYYQMLVFAEKYETVDINETLLLPTPAYRGPDFEERLREVIDVDALIEKDRQQLQDMANQRLPLPKRDLTQKDGDLIAKMNLLAQAIEVEEPPLFGQDINEEYIIEESLRHNLPTDKRILVDEIYKILYFNNKDPETYNINFWADYFKIDAATIRNVVNYMAYPVIDQKTKRIDYILFFKDTELAKSAHTLLGDNADHLDR